MADRAHTPDPGEPSRDERHSSASRARRRFTVDSLFSDTRPQAVGVKDLTDAKVIELGRIVADPSQPRQTFDPERLDELAASIRTEGMLQPIVVRLDTAHDRYVIVHGERRYRASRIAGLTEIPAIVRDVPHDRLLVHQLMENIVRDDLNAVDRAAAIRALRSQLGNPPWDDVAAAVGIKRSRLFQLLGTEKLSADAQADIREGRLSEKQSRALQGLSGVKQEAMRALMLRENLPAVTATRLSRAFKGVPVTPDGDLDAATAALGSLRSIVDPTNRNLLDQQSLLLFKAIDDAIRGSRPERQRLRDLASLAGAPRFTDDRLSKELNAVSRTLAALAGASTPVTAEAAAALLSLRDTLDAILER